MSETKQKVSAAPAEESAKKVYIMLGIWKDTVDVVEAYETKEVAIKNLEGFTDMSIKEIEKEQESENDDWDYNDYCGSRVVECEVRT